MSISSSLRGKTNFPRHIRWFFAIWDKNDFFFLEEKKSFFHSSIDLAVLSNSKPSEVCRSLLVCVAKPISRVIFAVFAI